MGQQHTHGIGPNSTLQLIQELPTGKVYKEQQTQLFYFLKEYTFTSEEAYQQAFIKFSQKLTQKNDNILNLQKTNTKVENTFCSTFYKIILVFEYINHSLADEINMRNKENRNFEQKQIWSILFNCTLAIAHLRRTDGFQYFAIGLEEIKLSEEGIIKILPRQILGFTQQSQQNQGKTKKLAMTILSCILMKKITNQSSQYLEALIDKTKCSKQLKKVLYLMIMDDTKFLQLEQHLFRLANDQNDSILSGVSTPVVSSHKKTVKQSNLKLLNYMEHSVNKMFLNELPNDLEDEVHSISNFQTEQVQNPDQNQDENNKINQQAASEQLILHERQFSFNEANVDLKMQRKIQNKISNPQFYNDITVRITNNFQNISNPQSLLNIQSYQDHKQLDRNIKQEKQQLKNMEKNEYKEKERQNCKESSKELTDNLYTDPRLLDLIKKDLEEISHKTRTSHILAESAKEIKKIEQNIQKSVKENIKENIKDNIKFNAITLEQQKPYPVINTENNHENKFTKTENKLKSQQNIQKRIKEQQTFGNILDQDASFKKSKKNQLNFTDSNSNITKNINKENLQFEQKQTKRKSQISIINTKKEINYKKLSQNVPLKNKQQANQQQRPSFAENENGLEYVNQTYQKGQYKGYKLNGLRHGSGTFFYKQGGKYIGDWKENKMNGKGTLYYPNNEIAYEGNWKDDQLHGYGTLYNEQVCELNGSFQYQDWDNVEEFWVKYQGEFNMDNKDGKGKLHLSNGQVFEGHFMQDMVEGEGVLNRQNGSRIRGIWRRNKLIRLY